MLKKKSFFENSLNFEEVIKGRMIFFHNRKLIYKHLGYVSGNLGLIGKDSNSDYCINLMTTLWSLKK